MGKIRRYVCKVLVNHKNASRINKVKKEKIPVGCTRSSICNFFQNQTCFRRSNKPYSCVCFFPLFSFTAVIPSLPCPLPKAADAGEVGEQSPGSCELCLPTSRPGHARRADTCPVLPVLPQGWTWLRSLFSLLAIQMNLAGSICLWDVCLFNLDEIGLYFQKGDEDWQAQHDYALLVSLCKQDHTLCSLQFVAMHCAGSKQTWHSDVPDHIRADLLAFSVIPIHCSLASLAGLRSGHAAAGRGSGRLPGTCLASLPHASSRACCNDSAVIAACSHFPLSAVTIRLRSGSRARAVFQHKGVPVSFYFSCWRIDFSGDFGVWDFLCF